MYVGIKNKIAIDIARAITPPNLFTHTGHHFLLHVTSKATTLRSEVNLIIAAKDMHTYVARGAADDSVCLQ